MSRLDYSLQIKQQKLERTKQLVTAVTGPVYRVTRYSPAGRRAGGSISVVGESKDKIKEARGNSLEQKKRLQKEKPWKKKLYRNWKKP